MWPYCYERRRIKSTIRYTQAFSITVDLEECQATEIADYISSNKEHRAEWPYRYFGSEYPTDTTIQEMIEDFLYSSHRKDGYSMTYICPSCGRFAVLNENTEEWKFYAPESKA